MREPNWTSLPSTAARSPELAAPYHGGMPTTFATGAENAWWFT